MMQTNHELHKLLLHILTLFNLTYTLIQLLINNLTQPNFSYRNLFLINLSKV